MELSLITKYEVTSADTDMYGRLRLSALVNFLVQSAIKSADNLGFGFEVMNKQNLFWVLSRLSLKIDELPKWNDIISVETWPKDIEKILYLRDYFIKDKENNIIAQASTGWLSVDKVRKRPKPIESINIERFTDLKEKHGLEQVPEKLSAILNEDKFDVDSSFFDIDLNQHVTTTRYIDWIMNTFPIEFHKTNYPKSLSVNFMKEIRPESKISIFREKRAENEFRFEGKNRNEESIAFRAKLLFKREKI